MNIEQAKQIPIIEFLEKLGFYPEKISGLEYWYKSPYRDERTASFTVNTKKNAWMDFGTGEGGGLLQLAERIFQERDIYRLLKKIEWTGTSVSFSQPSVAALPVPKERPSPVILKVDVLQNPRLLGYLKSRSIDLKIAGSYCKEVYYQAGGNTYYSIGFKNDAGGWELRNPLFKNSIDPKTFTWIKNGSDHLNVFEGFFDFLSFLQLAKIQSEKPCESKTEKSGLSSGLLDTPSDFLIPNSLAFLKKTLPVISSYQKINLFLDNDASGLAAVKTIRELPVNVEDYVTLYQNYKDMNGWLVQNYHSITAQHLQLKRVKHPGTNSEVKPETQNKSQGLRR